MNKPQLKVSRVITQDTIKNLQGRSIRLDIHAYDGDGEYDIEVQRADSGAGKRRARYNGSVLDANALLAGDDSENLPETYIIFITEHDVLKGNLPIYHIERTIQENASVFDDGLHLIYVNAEDTGDTPLGRLMHDFHCKEPDEMHYKTLADRVRYFKKEEQGVTAMCKAMEEMRKEAAEKASAKTAMKVRLEVAVELLKQHMSIEEIAKATKLSVEKITEVGRLHGLL
jgi:flagellar motor switch/type III secretory pathway protein FliN